MTAADDGAHLRIAVRDTGIGIDASTIAKLFTEFTQARRRVFVEAKTFLHDGEVVIRQIEQLRLDPLNPLHSLDDEARDLRTLPATARAAEYDWYVEHPLHLPASSSMARAS